MSERLYSQTPDEVMRILEGRYPSPSGWIRADGNTWQVYNEPEVIDGLARFRGYQGRGGHECEVRLLLSAITAYGRYCA